MQPIQPSARKHAAAASVTRVTGLILFALAALFLIAITLGAGMAPGYDMNTGAISDLGVIDGTALLFNASLLAVGMLNLVGGYLYFRLHGRRWILALFVVASIGSAGAGLAPIDRGSLHSLFALLAFLCFNLEAIAVASVVTGPMRAVSAFAGLVGLAFVVLMVLGDSGNGAAFGPIGHGGTERMIVYPPMLWLVAIGGYLMSARET